MPDPMELDSPFSTEIPENVSRSRGIGQSSRVHGKETHMVEEEEEEIKDEDEDDEDDGDGKRPIQEKTTASRHSTCKGRRSTKVRKSMQCGAWYE